MFTAKPEVIRSIRSLIGEIDQVEDKNPELVTYYFVHGSLSKDAVVELGKMGLFRVGCSTVGRKPALTVSLFKFAIQAS